MAVKGNYHHVHLISPDPGKTAEWYVQFLGGEIARDEELRGARNVRVNLGGCLLNIRGERPGESFAEPGGTRPYGIAHFCFAVDDLEGMHCEACRADAPRVTEEEIAELQPQIPDWQLVERDGIMRLERVYEFGNFESALDYTNRVGALAEEEGHHPAILLEWGKVTVSWWTHAIGGLHKNDFICAAKTDALA